ncbi:amidohydrolase family protein [Rhodoplanes sp. TEM]|uniref:Amidohydrolase family protein n=1 Tax=Rhodoplanes tepidamans TaxID=200616 RepID=A0ABT5JBK1_RHOTP|nr:MULTISPECIES: amidohydrolase family protein [Rhodoplanes]MDC7787065.1 amidohydrolase family protein [Rhodoplanes tepidamans]MDC7987766.1 amidohydrolase family protein [Rhodoplanes sp. TEM]MDQ0359046.1 2,3-dihydroxybenzoate decarboxylase [Rhodoplanes tepidamans]
MVTKIALEEHALCPSLTEYWYPTVADVPDVVRDRLLAALTDFGEARLAAMDRAGIGKSVIGIAGPGVQVEPDTARAIAKAKASNDYLATKVAENPARFAGFAHLPLQDATAAADELQRCVEQLKFRGAMVNGHTLGRYLDDPAYAPFWERAAALKTWIYLHPADPVSTMPALAGTYGLKRATWEWGVETGTHALRLVFGGVFDRYPGARLMLGHLGETLPYLLWRFDSRAQLYGVKLPQPPSFYIKRNIAVTTSGMSSAEPLACALAALGTDRVCFASDHPFEDAGEAGHFLDTVALPDETRVAVASGNAKTLLGLA